MSTTMTPPAHAAAARAMRSPSLTRVVGLLRHNLKLWLADVQVPIVLVGMPLAMTAFLRPVYRDTLAASGLHDATGAEQAVPGMAVMFALLGAGILAADLHRERQWATWDRLRASGARAGEIIVGKLLPALVVIGGQLAVLFAAGVGMFGLEVAGSVPGLAAVAAAFAVAMLALGLVLSSLIRSITTLGAVGNALAVTFAGLGGAVVPLSAMPGWAMAVAPLSPAYWAMLGFRAAVVDAGGTWPVLQATGSLLLFALLLGGIAAWRLRNAEPHS